MGCICNYKTDELKDELQTERIKQIEKTFRDKPELMNGLTRCQAKIRGILFRQRLSAEKPGQQNALGVSVSKSKFVTVPNNKITDQEIQELFEKYPPLKDGVDVKLHPSVQYDNQAVYYGEWSENQEARHGRGIQIWTDGSRYEGYWKANKANIKGRLLHADGDIYEGEWLEDKAHGFGIYTHIDGANYEGNWKEDKQDGKGKESWPDGASYEGDYKQGKKCGDGKFKWADGSVYDGNFEDNNINGKGMYTWGDGRVYIGDWKNNKMHGKGSFTWPDGRKYSGDYKDDKKDGYGIFEWADGRKYKGYWKDGKQDGDGEFFNPNTNIWKKGLWEMGRRVKWITEEPEEQEE